MSTRLIDAGLAVSKIKLLMRWTATPEARALGVEIISMLGDERQIPTASRTLPTQEQEAFAALRRINEACVQFMAEARQYQVDTLKAWGFAAEIYGMTFVVPGKGATNGNL